MSKQQKKALLVILDGWGKGLEANSDAIQQAETPFVDSLYKKYPNSNLVTYGLEVGLPEGQMGNSEVGHLNIGAGRVVYQELARINKAVKEKTLDKNPVLVAALKKAKTTGQTVHLMGLVSDGGVHSHIEHLKALCNITEDHGLEKVFIHAFMDGRDTSPKGGINYLAEVQKHISKLSANIASITGRYYAMDRDNRWERIKIAYDALANGTGKPSTDLLESIQQSYDEGITDEFLMPIIHSDKEGQPLATIKDGDLVLFFNFRTDRPRQITEVLTQNDMPEQGMKKLNLRFLTMTRYDQAFKGIEVLFTKDDIKNTLGAVLAEAGKTQTRIAETEKYPHVTFFFNGGREEAFEGENRILIPSPKVATYDLQPEMSAKEITTAIIENIETRQPDFICLNYANTDMVGHTGDFDAAMKAANVVDNCLKQLLEVALQYNYEAIVIADHGNSDYMINEDGSPNTAHTTNLVPCFYISKDNTTATLLDGKLADVAPSILHILDLAAPSDFDGNILIQ